MYFKMLYVEWALSAHAIAVNPNVFYTDIFRI